MVDNSKEPKLTYALDTSGKMVHVLDVARGKYCNCRCPKCKEPLDAKQGNGGRQPHFAHQKNSDCQGAYMSALHKLAEQIIEEEKAVMVPSYKIIGEQKLLFKEVEVEQRVDRNDMQPDLVGITEDSKRWIIEIRNTHEVDITKRQKIIDNNITCLEINVRDQTLENLKSFLLESTENREWINNPIYEKRIEEIKREKVNRIVRLLSEKNELIIPVYKEYEQITIRFKDIQLLSKSNDGLYARIKVLSLDGISYVFNIGSFNVLNDYKSSFKNNCNELTIATDNLSPDSLDTLDVLYIRWIYHYVSEKEREARIKDYKSNPKYEVRLKTDCNFNCKYRPFLEDCIYLKSVFLENGKEYVVCNKEKRIKDELETPLTNNTERPQQLPNIHFVYKEEH